MGAQPRDLEEERIHRDVGGEACRALLRRLQRKEPALRGFDNWDAVIAFMRGGAAAQPAKDAILRAVLSTRRRGGEPCWRFVLLAMFWPGLKAIYWRKIRWDKDRAALWQHTLVTFLFVVEGIDIARRPRAIARKIVSETARQLHRLYQSEWRRQERVQSLGPGRMLSIRDESGVPSLRGLEIQELKESALRELWEYLSRGWISGRGFMDLVQTKIHGLNVSDWARLSGRDREAVRKSRQRAELRIRQRRRLRGERVRLLLRAWERWEEQCRD